MQFHRTSSSLSVQRFRTLLRNNFVLLFCDKANISPGVILCPSNLSQYIAQYQQVQTKGGYCYIVIGLK
jgi:hypothetical protein